MRTNDGQHRCLIILTRSVQGMAVVAARAVVGAVTVDGLRSRRPYRDGLCCDRLRCDRLCCAEFCSDNRYSDHLASDQPFSQQRHRQLRRRHQSEAGHGCGQHSAHWQHQGEQQHHDGRDPHHGPERSRGGVPSGVKVRHCSDCIGAVSARISPTGIAAPSASGSSRPHRSRPRCRAGNRPRPDRQQVALAPGCPLAGHGPFARLAGPGLP